jgi:hypothetical protein
MDEPGSAQPESVNHRDPATNSSEDDAFVCEVSGTVTEGDCPLSGIWVWNSPTPITSSGQALSEEIQTNGVPCESGHINSGAWFFDATSSPRVPGFLGDNAANRANYIAAVAIFSSSSGCENPPPHGIIVKRDWNGKKSAGSGCPINDRRRTAVARMSSDLQRIAPTIDGDWLHYAINVVPNVNFFRLLDRDGVGLLKADEIAVAAQVHWRPAPNRELVIRDPQGISDCRIRDAVGGRRPLMRFQGLRKFGLVVWQPTVPRPTVVTSQCRSNPLELSLDPEREIIVELNDNNESLRDNEGTIDLWVKLPPLGT